LNWATSPQPAMPSAASAISSSRKTLIFLLLSFSSTLPRIDGETHQRGERPNIADNAGHYPSERYTDIRRREEKMQCDRAHLARCYFVRRGGVPTISSARAR